MIDINKLSKMEVFQGLTLDAIRYIGSYCDWMDVPNELLRDERVIEVMEASKDSVGMVYVHSTVDDVVVFGVFHGDKVLFGRVYDIINNVTNDDYLLALKEYDLPNGEVVREVVQTVEDDVAFLSLEIDSVTCFEWHEDKIKEIMDKGDYK